MGVIYTRIGDTGRALECFHKAYEEHSGFLVYAHLDPRIKPLRGEARFKSQMHRIGKGRINESANVGTLAD